MKLTLSFGLSKVLMVLKPGIQHRPHRTEDGEYRTETGGQCNSLLCLAAVKVLPRGHRGFFLTTVSSGCSLKVYTQVVKVVFLTMLFKKGSKKVKLKDVDATS